MPPNNPCSGRPDAKGSVLGDAIWSGSLGAAFATVGRPGVRPYFRVRENMSRLRFRISMSLDGFVAGPCQSVDNPLGIGGMRLHQWVFPLAVWRAMHGLQGGEVNESTRVVGESLANIGATVMGRNMFGGHPGPWDARKPWNGWWGVNPPFHHPVFVLTHHAREPLR
jgi:hypothetical protein